MNGELKALLVLVDQAFDLDEVILLEGFEDFLDVVPHFGFELSAAIAESQGDVRLACFFRLDLFCDYDECRGDDFVFVAQTVADEEVLHEKSEYKARGRDFRNFRTERKVSRAKASARRHLAWC